MAGAGIVSGFDMTSEAALAKLSYVLGQPGLSLDDRKKVCVPLGLLRDSNYFCVHVCLLAPEKARSICVCVLEVEVEDEASADPVHPGHALILFWRALGSEYQLSTPLPLLLTPCPASPFPGGIRHTGLQAHRLPVPG